MAKFINGKIKPKKVPVAELVAMDMDNNFDIPARKDIHEKKEMQMQAYSPAVLLSIAVEKGRSLEEIGKLMDLQDRWEAKMALEAARIAKSEFVAAKGKFQFEVPRLIKKTNVKYPTKKEDQKVEYSYAELGDISESIKESAFKNGLTYDWKIVDTGKEIEVTCILSHIGGHETTTTMKNAYDISGGKTEMHAKASTISYLQRYTLVAILGLTTASQDDDGRGNKVFTKHEEVSDIPSVTTEQFGPLMSSVMSGKMTVDKIKEMRTLTDNQEKALQVAEEARKNRPS